MALVVDCHVHLYSRHDEGLLFDAALKNLGKLAPGADRAIILAEREGTDRFGDLLSGKDIPAGYAFEPVDECSGLIRSTHKQDELLVVAGRQIATLERLEVLTLCSRIKIPDGLSFWETLRRADDSSALRTLTWAPGKWLGERGKLILEAIRSETCRPMFLCDTTLRPWGWPRPKVFSFGGKLGIPVLAGSDPLPMAGEELQVGRFATFSETAVPVQSGADLRATLLSPTGRFEVRGSRNNPISWALRYGSFMQRRTV